MAWSSISITQNWKIYMRMIWIIIKMCTKKRKKVIIMINHKITTLFPPSPTTNHIFNSAINHNGRDRSVAKVFLSVFDAFASPFTCLRKECGSRNCKPTIQSPLKHFIKKWIWTIINFLYYLLFILLFCS
jgi:hypothetical protein